MSVSFWMDARTLCGVAAATLACLLLLDIQSLRQTARQPMAQAGLSGAVQERVVTREFNLVDDSGQTRVRLGMNDLNAPALSLSDQNGQERALLRLNQNDVPSLRLYDSSGTLRQGLGFTSGTLTPHLWFFDESGSTQQLIPGTNTNWVNISSTYVNPSFASADIMRRTLSSTQPVYATYSAHAATGPYHAALLDDTTVWVNKNHPGCMTLGMKGDTPPAGTQWIRVK